MGRLAGEAGEGRDARAADSTREVADVMRDSTVQPDYERKLQEAAERGTSREPERDRKKDGPER